MQTKKILLIAGTGVLIYLLFKKSSSRAKSSQPSVFKKFATDIAASVAKPLNEVADDV